MSPIAYQPPAGALGAPTAPRPGAPSVAGWRSAWIPAVAVFTVVVIRLHELVPQLALIRPTIMLVLVALWLHISNSRPAAWRTAFHDPQLRLATGYTITAYLMVPFALWLGRSLSIANSLPFGLIVITMLLLVPPTRAQLDRITFSVAVITTIYALGVLSKNLVVDGDRLTTGGMYDPNDLAALLLVAMHLALGVALRKERPWKRLLGLACAGVLLFATLRTSSRGGMLAMVTGLLTLGLALPPRRILVFALVAAIGTPVLWQVAPAKFRERAETLVALDEDYNTTSTAGRTYLWKRGIAFFVASPLVGVGAGNFEQRLGEDFRERTGGVGAWHTAHNTYVQVMVELGIAGITFLLLMLYRAFRTGWQLARPPKRGQEQRLYRPELLAATVSWCSSAFFLSHGYSFLLFGVIALSALAARVRAAEAASGATAAFPGAPTAVLRRIAGRRGGLSVQPVQPVLDDHAASLLPRR